MRPMRVVAPWTCAAMLLVGWWGRSPAAPQPKRAYPVALADLVGRSHPLAVQDLSFDARFAELALEQLASPRPDVFDRITRLPATTHILRHARQFDYDVAKQSEEALVRDLLQVDEKTPERVARCGRNLRYVADTMLTDPSWVTDVLRYLPAGFRFRGSALFFTYGYDIGVALAPTASLNLAHSHFDQHPRELVYYAIHELHHVGFMTYQPPRRLADLKTCADVLGFIRYATQMEGMAVYAPMGRRRSEHALGDNTDYVALADPAVMLRANQRYEEIGDALRRRGNQPADADAMKAIEQMSNERLWYRVGAQMAERIEERFGRERLIALIEQGPDRFFEVFHLSSTEGHISGNFSESELIDLAAIPRRMASSFTAGAPPLPRPR